MAEVVFLDHDGLLWFLGTPEPQKVYYSRFQDPTTWAVVDGRQVSVTQTSSTTMTVSWSGRRGQPMFYLLSDHDDLGNPLPFRTDGRVNHWYGKWVARLEGRG